MPKNEKENKKVSIHQSQKKSISPEKRREITEREWTEWNPDSPTIKFAWLDFKVECRAKRLSPQTLAYYDRFYKKFQNYLINYLNANEDTVPVDILLGNHWQVLFVQSLGDVIDQTVNSYLRAYRAFGNYCEKRGWIEGFKCPIREVVPEPKPVYTDKELEKLLKKPDIEDFVAFRNYTIINLLLSTGARENTIINIKIKDVDLEEGYITFTTTKAHKVVRLPLEPKALVAINEFIVRWRNNVEPDDYLFCNWYGEKLSRSGMTKSIAEYNERHGVSKSSIHLFRHTFAKNWITDGGDIITLAQVLTHSELDMVKRYANLYDTDIRDKVLTHSTLSKMRTKSGKTIKNK